MDKIVSVIMPAHNEEKHIGGAIKSISDQSYDNVRLIIIDDNSTDNTYKEYKKAVDEFDFRKNCRTIKYSKEVGLGSAAKARNVGAKKYANGDILIFHDADCVAHPDMVLNVVKCIEFGFDGVATKTEVVEPKTIIERAIKVERNLRWEIDQKKAVEIGKGAPVLVANMTYDAFMKIGGFNESIFYFEDQDLTNRFFDAGFKAVFDPTVIEYHNDPSTLQEQINQSLSNGKGLRTIVAHGEIHKLTIPLYPIVFLIGIIALVFGYILIGLILLLPILMLYIILLEKNSDILAVLAFLPLFLIRNVFKLIGMIKR